MSFVASAAIRSPAPGETERWMPVPDGEHSGKIDIVEPVSRGDRADAVGDELWVPSIYFHDTQLSYLKHRQANETTLNPCLVRIFASAIQPRWGMIDGWISCETYSCRVQGE